MPLERTLSSGIKEDAKIYRIGIMVNMNGHTMIQIEYAENRIDPSVNKPTKILKQVSLEGNDFLAMYNTLSNDGEKIGVAVKRVCYEWMKDKKVTDIIAEALKIQYTGSGSSAVVDISGTTLTTTITGGPGGENLNLTFTNFPTIKELVDEINTNHGSIYTASLSTIGGYGLISSVELQTVTAQDIKGVDFEATGPSVIIS